MKTTTVDGEIAEASARREGDYDGIEEFRDGYEEDYGEGSWDPDKSVNVIEFEYIKGSRPGDDGMEQSSLEDLNKKPEPAK